jgi:hypothetical protein
MINPFCKPVLPSRVAPSGLISNFGQSYICQYGPIYRLSGTAAHTMDADEGLSESYGASTIVLPDSRNFDPYAKCYEFSGRQEDISL